LSEKEQAPDWLGFKDPEPVLSRFSTDIWGLVLVPLLGVAGQVIVVNKSVSKAIAQPTMDSSVL
jgi:hypothetical protein